MQKDVCNFVKDLHKETQFIQNFARFSEKTERILLDFMSRWMMFLAWR